MLRAVTDRLGDDVRVAIFGGMFDPVHNGHLHCAKQAVANFNLDKVFFVPSMQPPHKKGTHVAAEDRFKMVELAIEKYPSFEVSRCELDRGAGMSYTVDTVMEFRQEFEELYFIIGMDAFSDLALWRSPEEVLNNCNLVVIGRPEWNAEKSIEKVENGLRKGGILPAFKVIEEGVSYSFRDSPCRLFFSTAKELDISSSLVREKIVNGDPVEGVLPESVLKYIKEKGLYA